MKRSTLLLICLLVFVALVGGAAAWMYFSPGGALSAPYTSGAVELHCEWGSAINIDGIQKIVLGDLVLWENDP